MAEEQKETGGGDYGGNPSNERQAEGGPLRPVLSIQRSTTPPIRTATNAAATNLAAIPPPYAADPVSPGAAPLHRAGTLPIRRIHDETEGNASDISRRRGRTISARPKHLERLLSPRSQMFGRSPSTRNRDNGEGSLQPIPERAQAEQSSSRPRKSSISDRSFVSPGMRKRSTTWNMAPGRQRASTLTRRPTIAIEPQGQATGRDFDAQSNNFTLAGPAQVEAVAANQPYVDPGYTELNPAYDQPMNTRPVWGLAKPLPRVLRPGMVPTRSELKVQIPDAEQQRQDAANVDLEQGRVEATLNLNKLSPQLQLARQQRENRLVGTLNRSNTLSPTSPIVRQQSTTQAHSPRPPSIHSQVIEEEGEEEGEEDTNTRRPRPSDLEPVPEQAFPEWDATSAITEKEEEGDLDGDWIGENMPLNAYDKETDEIHNLHTRWSVIRLRFREPLAELLAVTVQLTLGFCADLVVVTSNNGAGNEATTDWAWGLATMVGIYIAGGISGAHLNPAISIMLWIYRGFPLRKVPIYMLAQILGAFIAALISFGIYRNGIIAYGGSDLANGGTAGAFITYPRQDYINAVTAFFTEFTGTAILAVAVLALGDDTNAPPGAGMSAFVLGLIITVLSMAFGYNTGAAMNPARDLGPRLALLAVGYGKGIFRNGYWFYGPWCGPISGAIFGAFLYDAAIFVGGESPVNYPRKRMVRAGKKWKTRMGQRARKGRGKVRFWGGREGRDDMGDGLKI
ncbi:aquaporin-like protein [Leptodontidium sp. MPI-SDFR-AT-0119]|nr:aquaporin-like protein [Leptodontidium sp. MPI-SDFR-AT-0119]